MAGVQSPRATLLSDSSSGLRHMKLATKTKAAVHRVLEEKQGHGFRRHLGASIIGRECPRQIWYIWRWAKRVRIRARILSLFDRGNREEDSFIKKLRSAGVHVVAKNPDTGEQFRISDHNDHFGGSLDGILFDAPDLPLQWALGEFKTHNDKSFKELVKKGVKAAKFEHYVQMQIYMFKFGLKVAIYFAINKNDDDEHFEIVELDESVAQKYLDRASKIINSPTPPVRINESPGWYLCQFCDFAKICHDNEPKDPNCRTCTNSKPIDNGKWLCVLYNYELSEAEQRKGCISHNPIPE